MKKAISFLTILILLLCIASYGTAEKPVRTEGIDIPVFTDMKKFDLPDTDAMAFQETSGQAGIWGILLMLTTERSLFRALPPRLPGSESGLRPN